MIVVAQRKEEEASSGTGEMGCFNDRTWGCGDCYNLHGLGSQWVAREEKIQVLCVCVFHSRVSVVKCKGAASSLVLTVSLSSIPSVFVVGQVLGREFVGCVRCCALKIRRPSWHAYSLCGTP